LANANDESGRPSFFAVLKVEDFFATRAERFAVVTFWVLCFEVSFLIVDKAHLLCSVLSDMAIVVW
jgi:hypothetical protein